MVDVCVVVCELFCLFVYCVGYFGVVIVDVYVIEVGECVDVVFVLVIFDVDVFVVVYDFVW